LVGQKPRWKRFVEIRTCPFCFDAKGHAGLLDPARGICFCVKCFRPFRDKEERKPPPQRQPKRPIPIPKVHRAPYPEQMHFLSSLVIRLSSSPKLIERTEKYLGKERGFPDWLVREFLERRYYRWYRALKENLVLLPGKEGYKAHMSFGVSRNKEKGERVFPISFPNLDALLIPLREEDFIVGFKLRLVSKEAKQKYVFLSNSRLSSPERFIPAVHIPRPIGVKGGQTLLVVEGCLKADVCASLTRLPTIGVLGAGRFGTPVILGDISYMALRWKCPTILLIPDADVRESQLLQSISRLMDDLTTLGYNVYVGAWKGSYKGPDDVLLAGGKIYPITPQEYLEGKEGEK